MKSSINNIIKRTIGSKSNKHKNIFNLKTDCGFAITFEIKKKITKPNKNKKQKKTIDLTENFAKLNVIKRKKYTAIL